MNRWVRATLLVILAAVVVYVLFTTVFPWVERTLEQDPTVVGEGVVVAVETDARR